MNFLYNLFNLKSQLTPHEFILKFIKDANNMHVQLEMYNAEKAVLQLESLKHVPIWFEWCCVGKNEFKDGFVIQYFVTKKENKTNQIYNNSLNLKKDLELVVFYDKEYDVINFVHFFNKDTSALELGKYIRVILDKIYNLSNEETQIGFKLSYIEHG